MKKGIYIALQCLFVVSVFAQQDAHYWSYQYGAKGLLLNGAVIASPAGETSIFYNPGAMAQDNNLGFTFSYLSPTYANLRTDNFLGDNNTIQDDGLFYAPGFAGVRFKPLKTDRFIVGLATFRRYRTDIKFRDRVVDLTTPDLELFRADINFRRQVFEEWLAVGSAFKINEKIAVGFSQYSVWHGEDLNFNFKKEITDRDLPTNLIASWRNEFAYNIDIQSAFITKFGFSYTGKNFGLGLTYTSPQYAAYRTRGGYNIEDHRIDTSSAISLSISNRRSVDQVQYKSPSSIGLGVDFNVHDTKVSMACEYFFKIKNYTVFEDVDDSFDGLTATPSNVPTIVTSKNKAVFNLAMGIQHKVSDRLTWFTGFRTDFNQDNIISVNQKTEYLGSVGDVFHFSTGGSFQANKNEFAIGLDFAYSSSGGGRQLVDLSRNITADNLFDFTVKNNVKSRYYAIMLFITYDFIFSSGK